MPRPGDRSVAAIERVVLAILDSQVAERRSLRELAARASMSPSYFSRTFHAVAGMSLRDYLRGRRLYRAVELLMSSQRSLTDIAVESGFYDLPHLDKTFRQCLGISPHDFRARHVAPADGAGRDARTQREVAQRLVKRSRQLRDTADLLIREAEATLAALPEIMRQAPPNVLRLVPRPREAPPGDLRSP